MTGKEKREKRKNLKRERIIETASELFSKKSYHEVMMDDVAKLTSIAKGTVYNYFISKEELYYSILKLRLEKLTNSLTDKIRSETNSIDALRSFVTYFYTYLMKYRSFFLIYRKESLRADNGICVELRSLENELRRQLTGIVKTGKIKGLFRNIDEDFAVNVILGSIYGTVHRGIDNHIPEEIVIKEREKIFDFILHGLLSGFDNNKVFPLINKTIVITRTVDQSKESSAVFSVLGAEVIFFPTLEIVPPTSWEQFDEAVAASTKIDFLIFTSAHSVKMFTKRCAELKIVFDYNKRKVVLIPRSALGREVLPQGLRELGAVIKSVPVYNVSLPAGDSIKENIDRLNAGNPDLFIFTSPSTFESFLQVMKIEDPVRFFKGYLIAAIGPTTKSSIEERRVSGDIIPDEFTNEGLAKAIVDHYKK